MNRLKTWLFGTVKHGIEITISHDLQLIEIEEYWSILGMTVFEDSRSVYIPRDYKRENLLVIAEAYEELRDTARRCEHEL